MLRGYFFDEIEMKYIVSQGIDHGELVNKLTNVLTENGYDVEFVVRGRAWSNFYDTPDEQFLKNDQLLRYRKGLYPGELNEPGSTKFVFKKPSSVGLSEGKPYSVRETTGTRVSDKNFGDDVKRFAEKIGLPNNLEEKLSSMAQHYTFRVSKYDAKFWIDFVKTEYTDKHATKSVADYTIDIEQFLEYEEIKDAKQRRQKKREFHKKFRNKTKGKLLGNFHKMFMKAGLPLQVTKQGKYQRGMELLASNQKEMGI